MRAGGNIWALGDRSGSVLVYLRLDDADHDHSRQMPDGGHQYPRIECELVGAALLEELPLEEHAGSLAELNDGA